MTQYPGYPVYPQQPQPQPVPAAAPNRRLKTILIAGCVVLALLFAGTAYVLFFSGAPPKDVVREYVTAAQAQDFAAARDLTCDDSGEDVRLDGNALTGAELLYHPEAMTWKQRDADTSGSTATVTIDNRYEGMVNADEPFSVRLDFELRRVFGSWSICEVTQYWVDEWDSFTVGDCVSQLDLQYFVSACSNRDVYEVVDEVDKAKDCPSSVKGLVETKDRRIQCLDRS